MLTPAQAATLKAYVEADSVLNALPHNGDGAYQIAAVLNLLATPGFVVWANQVTTQDIFDAIVWSNLTPEDAPDGTALWTNRNLQCQSKQLNLQTMLVGRELLPSGKSSVRTGLQDALTNLPSGVSGAVKSAGWTAVRTAMQRNATIAEKLLATGTGTTGSPASLGWEGSLNIDSVKDNVMGW